MVEALKKLREPAAFVLLGVTGVQLLVGLVTLLGDGGAYSAAYAVQDPTLVLALALVVGSCVLWERTGHARLLVLLSLIGVAAGGALSFLFVLVALAGPADLRDFVAILLALAIPVVVVLGLLTLLRGLPAPQRPQPALGQPGGYPGYPQGYGQPPYDQQQAYGQPDQQAYGQPGSQQPYGQPSQQQPTWQPDQSAGQSWQTAGDAASGAEASGWGQAGPSQGWQPTSQPTGQPTGQPTSQPSATPPPERPEQPDGRPEERKPSSGPQWWDQS